jgi:TctA family transporter
LPELIETYKVEKFESIAIVGNIWQQIKQGARDSIIHIKDSLRGGVIGASVGLIPGVGGAICDWLAYGATVASNKNETIPFGEGNIKGIVGPEGSNLAQKATAYVPTILFGIPAAPFEVIVMSLFMIAGLELGSPTLLTDMTFFNTLTTSYMWALGLTFIVSLAFIRYAMLISKIPFKIYFWLLIGLITWASVQYTGYWEDYLMLAICAAVGVVFKHLKLSRVAFIIGFVLSPRFESLFSQYTTLYNPIDILTRPISASLIVLAIVAAVIGIFFNKTKINYI